jgi:hypothetical protein
MSTLTIHEGDFDQYTVEVECVSHPSLGRMTIVTFAGSPGEALAAAEEKAADKRLRHQNEKTKWKAVRS